MNTRMFAIFSVALLVVAAPSVFPQAAPEHYEYTDWNPDPNFVPGDYPAPDTTASLARFEEMKLALAPAGTSFALQKEGEIAFQIQKNKKDNVLAYFREFAGYASFEEGVFKGAEVLVSLNSLDSGVPKRDNRVRALFFEAAKPERGVAKLLLEGSAASPANLTDLQDGLPHRLDLAGTFELGPARVPVKAALEVQWQTDRWAVKTLEPLELRLGDLGLAANVPVLMKECNHHFVSDAVNVTCSLTFK